MASPAPACQRSPASSGHLVASGKPSALPLAGANATWDCCVASVRSIAAERIVFLFPRVFHPARPSTIMTDDNRTRPPSRAARASYAPRYQPRSLVPSRTAQSVRSARSSPRTGGGGRRRYFAPSASTSTPSPAGSARTGRELARTTSRAASLPAKSACRGSLKLFDRLGIQAPAGSFPATRSRPSPRRARWWSMPATRSACTAIPTRTRSR